jgi:hypothetical protein
VPGWKLSLCGKGWAMRGVSTGGGVASSGNSSCSCCKGASASAAAEQSAREQTHLGRSVESRELCGRLANCIVGGLAAQISRLGWRNASQVVGIGVLGIEHSLTG